VHDDGAFWIPPELGVQRSKGSNDPVIVLEETVGSGGLKAGEVPGGEEEVARRVIDAEAGGGTVGRSEVLPYCAAKMMRKR
jgi:hypothetical protein